ncbi:MAG TPA: hypothetical protein VN376_09980 [Longilinea sp.]|nr:hypothetical protein [Longilinea sp.]
MKSPLATITAIGVGVIILIGYFLPLPFLSDLRVTLLGWAVILAGVATLVAILNLVMTHIRKLQSQSKGGIYSIVLLIAFVITLAAGLVLGPTNPQIQNVVTHIQVPVEASLMGVLAVSLAYACLRLLQRRKGIVGIIFLISVVVFLIVASGFLSISQDIPILKTMLAALQQLPLAGGRGILLGISLGGITTGLRVLLGADRPYTG